MGKKLKDMKNNRLMSYYANIFLHNKFLRKLFPILFHYYLLFLRHNISRFFAYS